ncbi:MAG: bifunctional 2-C-methyl-D-erythritol 4-phosphate cytidylyltransferase/2-C-methyl-D-erythritol 2,4-cyclodiphosphate synthase [Kordiimonadaceae bacterium]|nr:bifunctional 2-C-methyl-D-erythritol 4-phosphate cytidylyltransferase/2-C-methyl-D-erythritol 2,4-cyclodiphosphate synthase [Kordiimonadaceae bacterium]MBO6570286.1 bifunctional 2-C-methyl-D-erythritol 4-phosphate cytidylyltransferase/2-C-methyl-D-erythritol 2,4-cyclodiphosphate synthase [Kordiimonadaceae bacterium]MBO6965616.1 bifunctional 2-C-methyl-D-erythritol 4-phosphate cytidylyltransferase/2-C-methyl-D-erythritol 2,4-cyclodiphosphate synthase [Kordiimonadaceae bacterium]
MADTPEKQGKQAIIVVAGGRGSRAGDGLPKQYRAVGGVPLIRRTVLALQSALPDAYVQVVIHPDDKELFEKAIEGLENILPPAHGGDSRQQSVFNGLQALTELAPDQVYIHDAARPFVSPTVIDALTAALDVGSKAAVPVVPIVDTLVREVDGGRDPVDRPGLVAVQTPQAFEFKSIFGAHQQLAGQELTDDASVFEAAGGTVAHVPGAADNFKITRPEDFEKAEHMTRSTLSDIRMGSGYDVHRFEAGDHVWLCGMKIPFSKSLKGHSDADVGLHALTDAILAAISDGDIGAHFPPTDERWRGAPSDVFLSFAASRVHALGGDFNQLGVLLVCEAPKIRPHVETMRARIAEIVGIDVSRVSVQATTTEKLGFTGRGEGIAAQATATVALPAGPSA